MRRLTVPLIMLLACMACGRTISGPPECAQLGFTAVTIRDSAGDSIGVSWFAQCIKWRR